MTTQFNKFFSAILFAALAFFSSDSFSRATIAQLPSDPALVTGQLDNGLKYIVMKGPICLDGVSLTVMGRDAESISVSLVQYTQEHTNLLRRKPGDAVNLETDIFARYVEQIVEQIMEARAAGTP